LVALDCDFETCPGKNFKVHQVDQNFMHVTDGEFDFLVPPCTGVRRRVVDHAGGIPASNQTNGKDGAAVTALLTTH
jgi:hypothetical protein